MRLASLRRWIGKTRQATATARAIGATRATRAAVCERLESRQLLAAIFASSATTGSSVGTGPIITNPKLILIFWGANWTNGTSAPGLSTTINAMGDLVQNPYLRGLQSYNAAFGYGNITSTYFVTDSSPNANFTDAQVQSFVKGKIDAGAFPSPTADPSFVYFVITQQGTSDPTDPGQPNGEHSFGTDSGNHRFHYAWVSNPSGSLDFITRVGSHELVETMSDPEGTGWQMTNNGFSGSGWNEVADGNAQGYAARVDGYLVQSYWLPNKQAYGVTFGANQYDIDATATSGAGNLIVNGDQAGVTADECDVNLAPDGGLQITIDNNIIGFLYGTAKSQFRNVKFNGGNGNDILAVSTALQDFNYTVDFNGGAGYNTVFWLGSNGDDNLTMAGGNLQVNNSGGAFQYWSAYDTGLATGVSEFDINTNAGSDTIAINDSNRPLAINATSGNKTYNLNGFTTGGSGNWLTIFGSGNNDALNITPSSKNLASLNINSFHYYGNGGTDSIVVNNQNAAGNWTYTVNTSLINASTSGFALPLNIDSIEGYTINGDAGSDTFRVTATPGVMPGALFGGDGDDQFFLGDGINGISGNIFGNVAIYGQNGTDGLTLNDQGSSVARSYNIRPTFVSTSLSGLINYDSTTESVSVYGPLNVAGTFDVSGFNVVTPIFLYGGSAADSFTVHEALYKNLYIYAQGGTNDAMTVDDRLANPGIFRTSWNGNTIEQDYGIGPASYTAYGVNFYGVESPTYYGAPDTHTFNLYGTSNDITPGHQGTIIMGSGNDSVTVFPHDAGGNLTINGLIGVFGGGGGADVFTVDDTASNLPINYAFSNIGGASTTNIAGLGAANLGVFNDFENIVVNAGGGADTFTMTTWQSGNALSINSGPGLDEFDMTPATRSITTGITNMSAFSYDGGPAGTDGDHFDIFNDANTSAWTITRTATQLQYLAVGYNLTLNLANLGYLFASGGTQNDSFLIRGAPSADMNNDLYGAGGNDAYTFGNAGLTSGIGSYCNVNGAGGTDSIVVDDSADTVGRTLHVDQNLINGLPTDTLFPSAGGYKYGTIATSGVTGPITLRLGSGADTVDFAPVPTGGPTYAIQANNPTTAPGDTLNLALAAVTSPVFTPGVTGAGSYTFGNAAPMSYTGIETKNVDNVAPTFVGGQFSFNPPAAGVKPSVDWQFSENVGPGLWNTNFGLKNLTTNQFIDTSLAAYAFNTASNTAQYTFPGLAGGVLPDGNYHAMLTRVTDVAGNAMTTTATQDFFVLAGDANHDRTVDLTDFTFLASNFNGTGKTFSQGDFNYDGTVDLTDFTILASKFNRTLAPASIARMAAAPVPVPAPMAEPIFSSSSIGESRDLDLLPN